MLKGIGRGLSQLYLCIYLFDFFIEMKVIKINRGINCKNFWFKE